MVEHKPVFHQFLKPLVDQPGSKYTLSKPVISGPEGLFQSYTNEYLQHLSSSSDLGSQANDINNSVLILATLSRDLKRVSKSDPDVSISLRASPSEPFVYSFLQSALVRVGLHAHGSVRMLLWTWDRDKFNLLPRHIAARKSTALALEERFLVEEIVGSAEAPVIRRPVKLEVHSAINAARRMALSGVKLPEARQSPLHRAILKSERAAKGSVDSQHESLLKGYEASQSSTTQDVELGADVENNIERAVQELEELEMALARGEITRNEVIGKDKRFKPLTKEYGRMSDLRSKFDALVRVKSESPTTINDDANRVAFKMLALAESERRVVSKEKGLESTWAVSLDTEKERMSDLYKSIQTDLAQTSSKQKLTTIRNTFDNLEAFRRQLLGWDGRVLEPLECESEEFYPSHKMTLLDFHPKRIFRVPGATRSIFEHNFVRILKHCFGLPIEVALEGTAHGAAAALLPKCPSLHDPLKGGRIHLDQLRVRMLTEEMWLEIIDAFEHWPLRPTDEVLISQLGKSTAFTDYDNSIG